MPIRPASRLDAIEVSLIRQIHALATPDHVNLGIGEPNLEPDAFLREMARKAATEGSWRYTANAGNLSLREKLAARLGANASPLPISCGLSSRLTSTSPPAPPRFRRLWPN